MARELERLKSQFISMVSHELRTPLTSIRASMQLLIAEADDRQQDADQLVRVALSNADRLIRIVNDILDMSKIEAGEMMVAPKPTHGCSRSSKTPCDRSKDLRKDCGRDDHACDRRHHGRDGRSGSHRPGAGQPVVERGEACADAGRRSRSRGAEGLDGGRSPCAITVRAFRHTRSTLSSSRSRSSMAATPAESRALAWA